MTVRQLVLEQIACPSCGSSSSVYWLSGRDNLCGIPGEFPVVRCRNCQRLCMNPRPVTESLADCDPPDYSPHVPTAQNTADPAPNAAPRRWYLRWLPLRRIPGLKRLYKWLLEDRSQPVHCGMLQTLPDDGRPYDLAAAWHVLEHVPDVRGTLHELLRRLGPRGQLLISIPCSGCWEPRVFGSAWYLRELPRHLHSCTWRSITRLLSECAFVDTGVQHQRMLLNVSGGSRIVLLNRRPRSRSGRWLKSYPEQLRLFLQLLLAPAAHLLAFSGQGGRFTIFARKASGDSP